MNPWLRKNGSRILLVSALVLIFLLVNVDDWSRDFVGSFAEISEQVPHSDLQPFVTERSSAELIEAVEWAAARIGSWDQVGTAAEGDATLIVFVRTSRLLRLRDDIIVRVEDRGNERVLTATSQARTKIGDLGRNPRNLRRLIEEVRDVLQGAARNPAPRRRWS